MIITLGFYWVETLGNGGAINYIDEVLGRYRRYSKNITRQEGFVTQNELDHLTSCQIIILKYPQFFSDVMFVYSRRLLGIRHKTNYVECLWKSFCISPSVKVLGALRRHLITAIIILLRKNMRQVSLNAS